MSEEMIADSFAAEKRILDIVIEVKWKETDTFIIVHVEPQSYQQTDFSQRMFRYYSLLFGKYNKPILPIVVFTFKEQPKCEQYSITFKDTTVQTFEYLSLHLSSLNWRKFIRNPNPVSAALMSKMGYNNDEKVQVKIEFICIMSDLKIDPKKSEFLLRFFEVYLPLTDEEEGIVMTEIRKDPETFDITSLPISYIERGKKIGREEGRKEIKEQVALKLLEENLPVDLIVRTTSLSEKRILELKRTL